MNKIIKGDIIMERVSLERSDYFEGVLTVLRNGEVIIIDSMEFDSESLANLSDIVNNRAQFYYLSKV